jgi:hypothetical protein
MQDIAMFSSAIQLFQTVFAGYEVSKRSDIAVLEVRFAGGGLELSAYVTRGTIYVSNFSDTDPGG